MSPRDPHLDLLDEASHAGRVAERSARRLLADSALSDARLSGVLLDLAERRDPVTITTSEGRRRTGRVSAVALDHLTLTHHEGTTLLALDAVASVSSRPGSPPPSAAGDRAVTSPDRLVDALALLAEEREDVVVVVRGEAPTQGRLETVGADVLVLRVAAGRVVVALRHVVEVSSR